VLDAINLNSPLPKLYQAVETYLIVYAQTSLILITRLAVNKDSLIEKTINFTWSEDSKEM
jgi:hypothetical protein